MNPLLSTLSQDIITTHIIPYTYNPQPSELLKDIRVYHYTLEKMYIMFHFIYSGNIENKLGMHRLLKMCISDYLCDVEEIRHISYIKKVLWRIPLSDEKAEIYMIRRMWGVITPLTRLKCLMHYTHFFNSCLNLYGDINDLQ